MHHDQVAGLGARDRLDGGVIAVKAVRVLLAVAAAFLDFNNGLGFDFGGVGKSVAEQADENKAPTRFFDKHVYPLKKQLKK